MKFLGFEFARTEDKGAQFEDVLQRLVAAQEQGGLGPVTPDNCMRSPTVNAIVTAISRRLSVSSLGVYKKTRSDGRDSKELLTDHPVARLLRKPNSWQSRAEYWLDAASVFTRWGRFHAFKSRGTTGPIRELIPLPCGNVELQQDQNFRVTYRVKTGEGLREYGFDKVHSVRGPARNFLTGDSPVQDCKDAIALEIAAQSYGNSFFENGAVPLLVFKYLAESKAVKQSEAEKTFLDKFQEKFGGKKRHRAMVLPKGMDLSSVAVENDKAQMLETRKLQRTIIAGAFGVPPHLVGDLERATFNNVEQQDADFTSNVIQPVATAFEAAMERDLLTDDDRAQGVIIRFNLDSILRSSFKDRQDGSRVQREGGMLSVNEWREREGLNPISAEKGGDDYIRPANMMVAGEEPQEPKAPDDAKADDPA